jgi:hypothetical protein
MAAGEIAGGCKEIPVTELRGIPERPPPQKLYCGTQAKPVCCEFDN